MKQYFLRFIACIAGLVQDIRDFFVDSVKWVNAAAIKLKDLVKANYDLGLLHIENGNILDAKMRFMIVIKFRPDFALAHYHLARCHLFNLSFDQAKQELETALSLGKGFASAQYRLKLISRNVAHSTIPIQVVEEDYNSLANQYENYVINQLKYNAPELLAKAIAQQLKKDDASVERSYEALDIGCGTGLAGAYLAQEVTIKSQTGLDISEKMLSLAKTLEINDKMIYTATRKGDFHELESITEKYNVIMACMSLSYANDLAAIFTRLNNVSLKGAVLGVVVLKSLLESIEFNYDYACHSFGEKYLQDIFQKFNWNIVEQQEISLFVDGSVGFMFVLKKQ